MKSLILKKLVKEKKKRRVVEESIEVVCDRRFCAACLKNFYDTKFSASKHDASWLCPYCTGECFCARCRRQDQLTTVRGYLISLNVKDLVYTPQNANEIFGAAFSKSQNIIDKRIKR